MKKESVLVMQIMGQTALVMRATPCGSIEIVKVGPNFATVAKEKDLVTLVHMELPIERKK